MSSLNLLCTMEIGKNGKSTLKSIDNDLQEISIMLRLDCRNVR